MIIDSLKSFEKYRNLHEGFDKIYRFIRDNNLHTIEEGKHEIDGDRAWCTIWKGELKGVEGIQMEIHDSYIDIHVVLEGDETIGIKDRSLCDDKEAKYDEKTDIAFLPDDTPDNYVSLGKNNMAIIFPADAHAPLMGEGTIKKAVFKVRIKTAETNLFN